MRYRIFSGRQVLVTALCGALLCVPSGAQDDETSEALLVIRTNVAGARVIVDGEARGEAPRRVTLEAGSHTVRVEKDGHRPWEERIKLEAGEQRTLIATLEPTSGELEEVTPDDLLERADRFYDEKDWRGAAAAYEQFLEIAPDHAAAAYAEQLADVAVQRLRAVELVHQGLQLLESDQWDEAFQKAELALDLDPGSAEALDLRSRAVAGELKTVQRRTDELISQGRGSLDSGDWKLALDKAQRALDLDPNSELAMALRDEAIAAGESARSRRKAQAELLVKRGERLLDAEAWQDALQFAEQALQLDPENVEAAGLASAASAGLSAARRLDASLEATVEVTPEDTPAGADQTPVDASVEAGRRIREASTAVVGPAEFVEPSSGGRFVRIEAGTFDMGCTPFDQDCSSDERPVHSVTLTRDFYIGATEVTIKQYRACVAARRCPSLLGSTGFDDPEMEDHPAHPVSWRDAVAYCRWIGGRLPTEAEWEYAARGGQAKRRYHWGNNASRDHANYSGRHGYDEWGRTSPAMSFPANDFGLYDMLGNVWEWVADWHQGGYYRSSPSHDPPGPDEGSSRVLRGGAAYNNPDYLRVSDRFRGNPRKRIEYAGIRCVLDGVPSTQ